MSGDVQSGLFGGCVGFRSGALSVLSERLISWSGCLFFIIPLAFEQAVWILFACLLLVEGLVSDWLLFDCGLGRWSVGRAAIIVVWEIWVEVSCLDWNGCGCVVRPGITL